MAAGSPRESKLSALEEEGAAEEEERKEGRQTGTPQTHTHAHAHIQLLVYSFLPMAFLDDDTPAAPLLLLLANRFPSLALTSVEVKHL